MTLNANIATSDGIKRVSLPSVDVACTNSACSQHGVSIPVLDDGTQVTCLCGTIIRQSYSTPQTYTDALQKAGVK